MQAVLLLVVGAVSCVFAFDLTPCDPNPCQNHGKCVDLTYGKFKCICKPGTTGKVCQTNPDDCAKTPRPCNECGTCKDGFNKFTCNCLPTMTGDRCQIGPCVNGQIECQNGGTCIPKGKCDGKCKCVPGFTGNRCQTNIDDCAKAGPKPCNEPCGTCFDGINSFTCKCQPTMTGKRCQDGPCVNGQIICENGGTCIKKGTCNGECKCVPGFTGNRCQTDINECANEPCHCGKCIDGINSFKCTCFKNWRGPLCDKGGPCIPNPCQNGGKCILINKCQRKCICTKWWKGPFCKIY